MTCTIDGCIGKLVARGMCGRHYARTRRLGSHDACQDRRPNGAGTITGAGYVAIGIGAAKKQEHVLIVEMVLGRTLPRGVEVHHVNEIKTDNRNENFVVCQDRAYHNLIHMRTKAHDACGNASYRKCVHCKSYDDPVNMTRTGNPTNGHKHYHKKCRSAAEMKRIKENE
jgi:hypothetical protein